MKKRIILLLIIYSQLIETKKNLQQMFHETKIVDRVIDERPEKMLNVFLEHEGRNKTVDMIDKRIATEAQNAKYVIDIPTEPFDTWRFVLHSYLYNDFDTQKQIIGFLEMNRNRYRTYYRDHEYHRNLKTYTQNHFRKEHVITDDYYDNYPVNCKLFGDKNITTYDIWLYGRQQEDINTRPLRKYSRLRKAFNIKKFVKRYSIKLTHGATLQNYCTMEKVKFLKKILLPFIIVWCVIGVYGAIYMVYAEVEKARQAKLAAAREKKLKEEQEYYAQPY